MNSDAPFRKYCREVRHLLPCSHKEKRRILEEIRANIDDYRALHPEADATAVLAHFGSPLTIAAAYIDAMDTETLLKGLRIRKKLLAIVLILAAFILVTWLGTVTWAIINEILNSDLTLVISY